MLNEINRSAIWKNKKQINENEMFIIENNKQWTLCGMPTFFGRSGSDMTSWCVCVCACLFTELIERNLVTNILIQFRPTWSIDAPTVLDSFWKGCIVQQWFVWFIEHGKIANK